MRILRSSQQRYLATAGGGGGIESSRCRTGVNGMRDDACILGGLAEPALQLGAEGEEG
jgi:hypothetical protein